MSKITNKMKNSIFKRKLGKLPCRNCVTLAICKGRYSSYYNKIFFIMEITEKCDIVKNYLHCNDKNLSVFKRSKTIGMRQTTLLSYFKRKHDSGN